MEDKVSCIIPVRDGAAFLAEALDSVAAQTRPPDEVIVVDDGSTDGSDVIARAHPLVPTVIRTVQMGPGHARNVGIAASTGALIAFLDADDLWLPEKTALQCARIAEADRPDMVIGAMMNFADPGVPLTGAADWRAPQIGYATGSLPLPATLLRRSLFDRIGLFDPKLVPFGEDSDFLMRAIAAGAGIVRMERIAIRRRLHATNVTRDFDNPSRLDTGFLLVARHLARKRAS